MNKLSAHKVCLLIPSYNTGIQLLLKTVSEVVHYPYHVLVVIDGSTDGSGIALSDTYKNDSRITIVQHSTNKGKGETVLTGICEAQKKGFTHVLTMDSDGQHPAQSIPLLIETSEKNPHSIIMGQPVFGEEAPWARVYGRKLTSFWTSLETLWWGLGDTLFGMRVYPLEALIKALNQSSFARRFDFDPEVAVRIAWQGHRPIQVRVPVRYLNADEGGVSHFNYIRDNLRLIFLHFRLIPELILIRIIPFIIKRYRCS